MTDLAPFAEDGFNPVAYINAMCASRPAPQPVLDASGTSTSATAAEPLERFLAELEMKLQLGAEEVEASLQDSCTASMRRIPFALSDTRRLAHDVAALRQTAGALLERVGREAEAAAASVAPIAELERAKVNMEAACSTLREATELSGLFARVEDAFALGDLPRVADMLASMARSLRLVGEVPEFAEGKQRLAALEDRLQRRVEGGLADALSADDGAAVARLAGILLAVGRGSTVERLYCSSRVARAWTAWEEAAAGAATAGSVGAGGVASVGGGGWLLAWTNRLLGLLSDEGSWLAAALPGQAGPLLAALVAAVLAKVSRPMKERLAAVSSIPALVALQADVGVLCSGLAGLLAAGTSPAGVKGAAPAPSGALEAALCAALEPMEEAVARYGRLEDTQLTGEMAGAIGFDPSEEELESAVQRLAGGVAGAFSSLRGAIERCLALSGGTELRALLAAIDSHLQQYVSRLQSCVGILHERYSRGRSIQDGLAVAASSAAAPQGSNGEAQDASVMLALVALSRDVSSHLGQLEASLRTTIANVVPRLEALASTGPKAGSAPELTALRLAAFPAKAKPLSRLLAASQEQRFIALPSASAAVEAFGGAVTDAVYAALMAPVERALAGFSGMAEWNAGGRSGQQALPSFSAYPLPYVTGIGEYLMALPQQLEALMGEEGGDGDDGDELAAEWLDKVVSGAGQRFQERVLQLPSLSPSGAAQLAADAEYLANVMGALSVTPQVGLLTLQLFAGQGAEGFREAAAGALAEGSADGKVLKALARMRGIDMAGPELQMAAPAVREQP